MSTERRKAANLWTIGLLLCGLVAPPALAVRITYQGMLRDSDGPVTGTVSIRFSLWDSPSGGSQVGTSSTAPSVDVIDGVFSVEIDTDAFGPDAFDGASRWLEVDVYDSAGGVWVTLSPRQPINPAPYALYAYDSAGGGGGSLWSQNGANVYYDAGYVGVGLDAPLYPLHVTSTSGVTAVGGENPGESTFGYLGHEFGGVYGTGLYGGYFDGQGYFSDNVGIGVNPPTQKLDVAGTVKMSGLLMPTGAQNGYVLTSDPNGLASWQPVSGGSQWTTVPSGIFYNDGTVGIGTTHPNDLYQLHVESQGSAWAVAGVNTGENMTGYLGTEYAGVQGEGHYGVYGETQDTNGRGVRGYAAATSGATIGVSGEAQSPDGTAVFAINTANTGNAIAVRGRTYSDDGFAGYFEGQGYFAGNVGIGTTTPQDTLDVAGRIRALGFRLGTSSTEGYVLTCDEFGNGGWMPPPVTSLWTEGAGSTIHYTGGNVGIGTTWPQETLDVAGTVRMDGFKLDAPATTGYVLTCDADGNGTWQEAPGELDLPYEASISSTSAAFSITNSGTAMGTVAIYGRIDNPASSSDAAAGYFSASGSNGSAIYAVGTRTVIRANCQGTTGNAVRGSSAGDGGGYFSCSAVDGYGVKGVAGATTGSDTIGGWFESNSSGGKAVYAYVDGAYATAVKAIAEDGEGIALYADSSWDAIYAKGFRNAAKFYGDVRVYEYGTTNEIFHVDDSDGTTNVNVLHITGGSDLAEPFDVSETAEPGTVVEIDPDNPGKLRVARGAYNRRVAGVVSGANGVDVGMMLADLPGSQNSTPVALSGRVWVKCDASQKAIEPGDLLTTSDTPGHAMPVLDHDRAHGAVIGKAMSRLAQGETGMVLVLVNLQ